MQPTILEFALASALLSALLVLLAVILSRKGRELTAFRVGRSTAAKEMREGLQPNVRHDRPVTTRQLDNLTLSVANTGDQELLERALARRAAALRTAGDQIAAGRLPAPFPEDPQERNERPPGPETRGAGGG